MRDVTKRNMKLLGATARLLKFLKNEASPQEFSGIGMLIYRKISSVPHFSLHHKISLPKLTIYEEKCKVYLLQISRKTSPFHDGFIFFNKKGELTHISQYFAPPIVKKIKVFEGKGVRFHAALLGSYIKDVILTAVLEKNKEAFIFVKGKVMKL